MRLPREARAVQVSAIVLAGAAVLLTSCGGGGPTGAAPTPSSGQTTPPDMRTIGLIALGHSALTGYKSLPASDRDTRENSWVTGTNPAVDSLYLRLIKLEPSVEGHVANDGIDGSTADALLSEAQSGLTLVPHPQLVIIQTIDNDIRCDGTGPCDLIDPRGRLWPTVAKLLRMPAI